MTMMKLEVKKNPESKQVFDFINEALSKKAFLFVIACCRVNYEGRAVSRLGYGDRTIILKSDGSFMIHQDINLEPVNWQPPTTKIKVFFEKGKLYIKGFRSIPREILEVEISKTYLISYFIGKDTKILELAGYEGDMVEMIFKNPEIIEDGFRPTSREYYTTEGFVDIVGKDRNGNLTLLELKSRRAGVNAVKQLKRYLKCFSDHKNFVRGILVAPSITEDAHSLLEENIMEFKSLKPPKELKKEKNITLDFFK
jgi:endonuclease